MADSHQQVVRVIDTPMVDPRRVACAIKARLLAKGDKGRISRQNLNEYERTVACGVSGRLLRGRFTGHDTHEIHWES